MVIPVETEAGLLQRASMGTQRPAGAGRVWGRARLGQAGRRAPTSTPGLRGRHVPQALYLKLVHHLRIPLPFWRDVTVKVKGTSTSMVTGTSACRDRAGVRPEGGGGWKLVGSAAGLPGAQGGTPWDGVL